MASSEIGGPSSKKRSTGSDPSKDMNLQVKYDVFLSFRGPDYRETFVDFLYHRLDDAGVCTFKDDEELRVGEEIGPEVMRAINQSKISIVMFSKNYASSKWCLKEVAEMVKLMDKRKQEIVPIFLDVTPNEVKHQTGSFAEAFSQHEEKYDSETVQEWRDALRKVVQLKGLELKKETNGRQGEFIKLVLATVLNRLKTGHLNVNNEILVGMDDKVGDFERLLEVGGDGVQVVGIWGMGGIGKTTLAKVVYNKVQDKFDSSCFINDIRESSKSKSPAYLQSKLVSDILNEERKDFANVDEGIRDLEHRLGGKKALILLDDVDHVNQFKVLAGNLAWFGPGSRIIITSRDKRVIDQCEVRNTYEVKPLNENQALELFYKHAFVNGLPTPDLIDLSRDMVRATGMLPLALEVIGSFLYAEKKCKETWQSTLRKLVDKSNKEVLDKLMISYDSLDFYEKQMFLDIACLFNRVDSRIVSAMWDDCGFYSRVGIETLFLKSLIKITDDNEFQMHDLLRDIGRDIVEKENYKHPELRSRLWRSNEGMHLLNRNELQEMAKVEAISLEGYQSKLVLKAEQFRNFPKLRILKLNEATLDGNFDGLLGDLRWLSWHFRTFQPILPKTLALKNLVVLDLSQSMASEDWAGWSLMKVAVKLKVLNLTSCLELRKTPDFSAFRALERLILRSCANLVSIDPSIQQLSALVSLDARDCPRLLHLPQLGSLNALTELLWTGRFSMANCSAIVSPPTLPSSLISLRLGNPLILAFPNLRHLTSLKCLDLTCNKIRSVPGLHGLKALEILKMECNTITGLGGLEMLDHLTELEIRSSSVERLPNLSKLKRLSDITLEYCDDLSQVEVLGELESLERLKVRSCRALVNLPDLSKLRKLQALIISSCERITEIRGLGDSDSLEQVEISDCEALESLPNMSKLRRLRTLKINCLLNLAEIVGLEGLDSLRSLDVSKCERIEKFPDLSKLCGLQMLCIKQCYKVTAVQGLRVLESLEYLEISDCAALDRLPNMSRLKRLKGLQIKGCRNLMDIAVLEGLDNLERLDVSKCEQIVKLPQMSKLRRLQSLKVSLCGRISMVRGLGDLEFLEYLEFSDCEALESLPNMSKLRRLKDLKIKECGSLTKIVGLEDLDNLQSFNISKCEGIVKLPDLSRLRGLQTLKVELCGKITEVQGLGDLESLEEINISDCEALKSLSNISKLRRLKVLRIEGCRNLTEIVGLEGLDNLKSLDVSNCNGIEKLPELKKLRGLQKLKATLCEKITEMQGLGDSESLEEVTISDCEALKSLPNMSKLRRLKDLQVKGCRNLREIGAMEGLDNLKILDISKCKGIKKLPDLSELRGLQRLRVDRCNRVTEIQGLGDLEALERLEILHCEALRQFPNLSKLQMLDTLEIEGCDNLTGIRIEELKYLKSLSSISISRCRRLANVRWQDLERVEEVLWTNMHPQRKQGEETPESLFVKELQKRGITPTSILEEIKRIDDLDNGFLRRRDFSRRKAVLADQPTNITHQREQSMTLNSKGLEGLIALAKSLLATGNTFFPGCGPLFLITVAFFCFLYLYFIHDESKTQILPT